MYEELVTALRKRAVELPEKFSKNAENIDLFLKAVDAIKELRERVAASEVTIKRQSDIIQAKDRDLQRAIDAKPQWIPVTERLPKADERDSQGFAVPYLVMNGWRRVTARYEDGLWVLFGEGLVLKYVTHWMELPEPPKEGE